MRLLQPDAAGDVSAGDVSTATLCQREPKPVRARLDRNSLKEIRREAEMARDAAALATKRHRAGRQVADDGGLTGPARDREPDPRVMEGRDVTPIEDVGTG